jgi:hypothetical protein
MRILASVPPTITLLYCLYAAEASGGAFNRQPRPPLRGGHTRARGHYRKCRSGRNLQAVPLARSSYVCLIAATGWSDRGGPPHGGTPTDCQLARRYGHRQREPRRPGARGRGEPLQREGGGGRGGARPYRAGVSHGRTGCQ